MCLCIKYKSVMKCYDHVGVDDFGLHLASATRDYKKLIVGGEHHGMSYDQWAERCSGKLTFITKTKIKKNT